MKILIHPNRIFSTDTSTPATLVLTSLLTLATWFAQAEDRGRDEADGQREQGARVFPVDSRPYGHTYAEWAERFWQRAVSIPADRNPALGNGTCAEGQSGPVWFVLGAFDAEIDCTVPVGKALLIPPITYENDYPCPDPSFQPAPGQSLEDFLTEGIRPYVDAVTAVTLEVDGQFVQNPMNFRITTPLFYFPPAAGLTAFDPCLTGQPQPVVADGYWYLLPPLPPGRHVIHSTFTIGAETSGNTIIINVQHK